MEGKAEAARPWCPRGRCRRRRSPSRRCRGGRGCGSAGPSRSQHSAVFRTSSPTTTRPGCRGPDAPVAVSPIGVAETGGPVAGPRLDDDDGRRVPGEGAVGLRLVGGNGVHGDIDRFEGEAGVSPSPIDAILVSYIRQSCSRQGSRRPDRPGRRTTTEELMGSTAADYLCERLVEWGVDTVYGYPGDGINGILGALRRQGDRTAVRADAARGDGRVHGLRPRQVHRAGRRVPGDLGTGRDPPAQRALRRQGRPPAGGRDRRPDLRQRHRRGHAAGGRPPQPLQGRRLRVRAAVQRAVDDPPLHRPGSAHRPGRADRHRGDRPRRRPGQGRGARPAARDSRRSTPGSASSAAGRCPPRTSSAGRRTCSTRAGRWRCSSAPERSTPPTR